jgi:hypothetical protein
MSPRLRAARYLKPLAQTRRSGILPRIDRLICQQIAAACRSYGCEVRTGTAINLGLQVAYYRRLD